MGTNISLSMSSSLCILHGYYYRIISCLDFFCFPDIVTPWFPFVRSFEAPLPPTSSLPYQARPISTTKLHLYPLSHA